MGERGNLRAMPAEGCTGEEKRGNLIRGSVKLTGGGEGDRADPGLVVKEAREASEKVREVSSAP